MDEIQHDEETLFNRASFAKLKKSEAGFRLDNLEFLALLVRVGLIY